MARRKLPLIAERTFADARLSRAQLATAFEESVRSKNQISCVPGCSSCCHYPVLISVLEGLLLYQWLAAHGKWTPLLKRRVQETADLTEGITMEVWLLSKTPCPLLDEDSRCTAYEARPFNCRATISIGDPYYCHPHRLAEGSFVVSRMGALGDFHAEEKKLLKRHGLRHFLMPLSKAVLFGEAIVIGSIELEDVDRRLFEDFVAQQG